MNNLVVENLSFTYNNQANVIKNISFSINDDDILVILGASGDGKTTLLKLISGLLLEQEGKIILNDVVQNSIPSHNRKISYIFQENILYPHLTIYENLMMGFKKQKIKYEEKDIKIKEVLKLFKITKFINLKPKHLSLGEKQKISLAKSFLSNDDLYLFDEPFSSLDIVNKDKYLELIKSMHEYKQVPFIYVTHNQEDAFKIATKVMIIKEGKILQIDSLKDINENPSYLETRDYIGEKLNIFEANIEDKYLELNLNNKIIHLPHTVNYRGAVLIGIETNLFYASQETNDSFKAKYINSFIDSNGNQYANIEINNKNYVITLKSNQFFEKNQLIDIEFDKEYFLFDKFTHKRIK